jgi:hypothetical protein
MVKTGGRADASAVVEVDPLARYVVVAQQESRPLARIE